ncbi:hypothetical protein [Ralstonia sp. ASV6]|uniref:hypothetical protein n=1 Tax=Ralstonia sp. ASV6 TaxID=2795124 RepID=UPI0018ED029B|nr:hypothetical protein [Ralstonia sp. ASV6]
MRIPISQADLKQGRLTKISRALQKLWKADSLSLMQAQNLLAGLLGYRNLHELQANALADIPQPPAGLLPEGFSRAMMVSAVAWQLFRKHRLSLAEATRLAGALHLNELSVDSSTTDAITGRLIAREQARGRHLVLDEAHYLLNPRWCEKTPAALAGGVPAHKIAVLPDRRVFTWSALEHLIDLLPPYYQDQLRAESRYRDCRDDEVDRQFIRDELFPLACEPLEDYVVRSNALPAGFRELWVFDEHNACMGRVLHNVSIGGLIPELFSVAGRDLARAAVSLYCGDPVRSKKWEAAGVADYEPREDDMSLLTSRYTYGDRKYRERATVSEGPIYADARDLMPLPASVRLRPEGESFLLCGHVFEEAGQSYLRYQPDWLMLEDVPNVAMPAEPETSEMMEECRRGYASAATAVPDAAAALYRAVKRQVDELIKSAADRLTGQVARADMVGLLLEIVPPQAFNAYCGTWINESLPVRYDGDSVDNPVLVEEREDALGNLVWLGESVKRSIPEVFAFDDAALGYVLLHAEGQVPGGRHAALVQALEPHQEERITQLLVDMIYVAAYCEADMPEEPVTRKLDILRVAVRRVLDGEAARISIPGICEDLSRLGQRMAQHLEFFGTVEIWRAQQAKQARIREEGAYLYVGEPVPREKPQRFGDLMAGLRPKPKLFEVEQRLSDLTESRNDP